MNRPFLINIIFLLLGSWASAQVYIEMHFPVGVDPCQGLPVEVRVTNESNKPVTGATLQLLTGTHMSYRQGSLSAGNIHLLSDSDPRGPVFGLDFLDLCESVSFSFWLNHGCAVQSHEDSLEMVMTVAKNKISSGVRAATIFIPKISIINLGLFYDEQTASFKKKFRIVNIGQLALDSFSLYVSGDDRMTILNANLGKLSANGDTIDFNGKDFYLVGNGNAFFERGEIIDISQEVVLDACETDFQISHRLRLPCAKQTCEFQIDDKIKIQAITGTPKLGTIQDTQVTASPCRDGVVNLKIFNASVNGNFNLGNSVYNLFLNSGWSVIQNNQYTEPLRDNCLRIKEARLNGRLIPVTYNGFSGYGLDFRRLSTDPDGPGGMSDLDNDGFYDDLGPYDTIRLSLKYEMDPTCLQLGCDQNVFDYHILRLKGDYNNYCMTAGTFDSYYYAHSYQWSRPSVYTSSIKGVYIDQETDTIVFQTYKNEHNFLGFCDKDSSAIRIILPPVADLQKGADILVNGKPVQYTRNGNLIYFSTDTASFSVAIPVKFKCDPNSGSGGVNTSCTFCTGSGGPKYSLRIEVDYFCGDKCFQKIPLYCGNSPAFAAVCNPNGGGQNSPGKLTIKEYQFKRLTAGYKDSTKRSKINPEVDSISHNYFFTYDTFLIYIPIDILCDASYANVFLRLAYYPRLYYNASNQVDTIRDIQWLSDTLKYFDGETRRWSYCGNLLEPEFYNLNQNNFYRYFVREVNLSGQFGNCLSGSLSTPDSMILVIKAVIPASEYTQWTKTNLYSQLTYNQDGCTMQETKYGVLNIFTGKPYTGYNSLRQEYYNAPDLTKTSQYLSVCGDFRIETTVDSYGSYPEDPDPFKNEFRSTYLVDTLKITIPPFFLYQNNNPNYVRITRKGSSGNLQYDTSFIQPYVRDSLGYTIIEFSKFNDNEDFELVQHVFFFNLRPECYVTQSDTISIYKKFQYLRHLEDTSLHKTFSTISKIAVNTVGTDVSFDQVEKQILKDTTVSWQFKLSSPNSNSTPRRFFTYHNTWMQFENPSGFIIIDSLIEFLPSGSSRKHQPRFLGSNKIIYWLDTLYDTREFQLFTHFNSCQRDSIIVYSGNSCSGYPIEYDSLNGKCREYAHRAILEYEPEESTLRLELLSQPKDSLAQPCDSFQYVVEIYNSGLGHSFNNRFYMVSPDGMIFRNAILEYPKGNFIQLLPPTQSSQKGIFYWDLSTTILTNGIPGFYRVDENYLLIHITFDGNCDLEDGQSISFYMLSTNVCNQLKKSQVIHSDPFQFRRINQNSKDLYDIHLGFSADSACGKIFKVRCILTSKNDSLNTLKQKLYFIYAKELSFIPGTFQSLKHVDGSAVRFYFLDGLESVEVPLEGPILNGDSAVFELELERTCIELCKATDFRLLLNSEQHVSCNSIPNGSCSQLLQIQEWRFDQISLSPQLKILDSEISTTIETGGSEQVKARYLIENKSPFSARIDYRIDFYYDRNADGSPDTGDVLVKSDFIKGTDIGGLSRQWEEWSQSIPGIYTCNLIAVITTADNPCLCTGDTLILNPPRIIGESRNVRICHDVRKEIGFDSVGGYHYLWLQADRLSSVDRPLTEYQYPFLLKVGSESNDTVVLEVTKSPGCSYFDTVFIEIYRPGAEVIETDSIRCHGDAKAVLLARGIGKDSVWSYEWIGRSEKTSEIHDLGPGWYNVRVIDSLGCAAYDSILISEPPELKSNLAVTSDFNGYSTRCNGSFDGRVKVIVSGGTPDYTYLWPSGQGIDTLGGLSAGWVKVRILDKNLCPAEDSILLTEPPALKISTDATPAGCGPYNGGIATVRVTGGVPTYSILWNTGQNSDTLMNLRSGQYSVNSKDANGCEANGEVVIGQLPDPTISANIIDTTSEYGSSIRLSVWTNAVHPRFHWSPSAELSCDSCATVFLSPTHDQVIHVTVTDENQCTSEARINIYVSIIKDAWAPNVFSPNGDSQNDRFTIFGKPTLQRIDKLQIFDRWGELVYEEHDLPPSNPNFGWDGTFKGTSVNPAVFAYVAYITFVDGEKRILYGDVTLIK